MLYKGIWINTKVLTTYNGAWQQIYVCGKCGYTADTNQGVKTHITKDRCKFYQKENKDV